VEAGADFQEAGDAALDADAARGGFGDAAEDFEQGRFAGAIAANDADDFALFDGEGDVAEGPEVFGGRRTEGGGRRTEDGDRRTEDGDRRTEDGGRRTEIGGRRTEGGL